MKTSRIVPVCAMILAFMACRPAVAAVKLPRIFADRAVLQRGMAVPIWGTAQPGETVSVSMGGQTQTTQADDPTKDKNRPCALYNAMLAPLQPYAIRGVIWYQGEANNHRAEQYRTLFPAMIADWRKTWGEGDIPFFFVQITPHFAITPEIREAQWLTAKTVPNTALIVTVDVGEALNIHPAHKEPVGRRLSLAARALTYGEKIEYSGPMFESMKIEGGKAILKFQYAAGLKAKDGELKGFTIAAADHQFVPARAIIEGETVVVSAEQIRQPAAVRYGWANVPDVNLFNGAGLPASPFRTDVEK